MLEWLKITGAGPKTKDRVIELDFAESMNFITGDNGLGKTFILDVAWWALTRTWPAPDRMTLPQRDLPKGLKPVIEYSFTKARGTTTWPSDFDWQGQYWKLPEGRPPNPGMVIYAQVDGGFAVWDPARNHQFYAKKNKETKTPPAYIFSSKQVWDGYQHEDGTWLCNGLIRDWASWQKENKESWELLRKVIRALSPSDDEPMQPGDLTRISLDDVRDMPTIRMPYGMDIPLAHTSAGMRRIITLAYLLVWTWQEHRRACQLIKTDQADQITFLIDEIEAHLHPKWQRRIMLSLSEVMAALTGRDNSAVQLIVATHAPLVLASIESYFEAEKDRLFHLGFDGEFATVEQMSWALHGDASNWLTSPVFALDEARSLNAQKAIQAAQAWMAGRTGDLTAPLNTKEAIDTALRAAVPSTDDIVFQWQLANGGGKQA